jgi:hypothetical protein
MRVLIWAVEKMRVLIYGQFLNNTGGKLPPISTTLAVNLPSESTTSLENNGKNIRLLIPLSEHEEKKIICMLTLLPNCPNKMFKTFVKIFFTFATSAP